MNKVPDVAYSAVPMDSWCPVRLSDLSRYLDGESAGVEASDMRAHLAECARCQGLAADRLVLGSLLMAQREDFGADLGPDFVNRVMEALPPAPGSRSLQAAQPPAAKTPSPIWQGLLARLRERSEALLLAGFGAAVAATLVVVLAPAPRGHLDARPEEAAENEAHIHRLDVSSEDQHAIVLQSAEGNTVIWMAPDDELQQPEAAAPDRAAGAGDGGDFRGIVGRSR